MKNESVFSSGNMDPVLQERRKIFQFADDFLEGLACSAASITASSNIEILVTVEMAANKSCIP